MQILKLKKVINTLRVKGGIILTVGIYQTYKNKINIITNIEVTQNHTRNNKSFILFIKEGEFL